MCWGKSYRSISLLSVLFKIPERLSYVRVEPIIDPLLPQEQAGCRHGRLTLYQVTLLTQEIEDIFSARKKAGAVFVDLTAAYDTLWHCGITCKLLRLLPDRHMVHIIMEMVDNHSFTLSTGNSKRSSLRHLKNGVPQGYAWAPLLFNICDVYISDLPKTVSRCYAYIDDLAIMHADGEWQAVERVMSKDQGRSQTFSFGGATGGARFATRGAVNGLCRTFRKRPGKFLGGHCGGSGPPGTPLAPPLAPTKNVRAPVVFGSYCPSSQNLIKKFA